MRGRRRVGTADRLCGAAGRQGGARGSRAGGGDYARRYLGQGVQMVTRGAGGGVMAERAGAERAAARGD